MATAAQIAANRMNAALSTGPKTEEGKLASSGNNSKLGLTGKTFTLLGCEDQAEFEAFRQELEEEHNPQTPTEQLLVQRMAQHHWLAQRAILQQDVCFKQSGACWNPKDLALFLRYQTTHDRAFHKCLQELRTIRAERLKEQIGFESQREKQLKQFHEAKAEARKDELHEAKIQLLAARIQATRARSKPLQTEEPQAPSQTCSNAAPVSPQINM